MGKAKDGSECFTKTNKSGGKYVTCKGTQGKSKAPVKSKAPEKATDKQKELMRKRRAEAKADKAIKEASDRIKKKKAQAKPKPKAKVPTESEVQTTTKDFHKLYPKDNQAQINEQDKEGNIIKRTIVHVDDLFDVVVKSLEKKGYSFSKNQLEEIEFRVKLARNLPNENKGAFYGTGPKKGQRVPPKTTTGEVTEDSFWYIKPAKGKTEMMIIYTGRNNKKLFSTRVRKKK